MVIGGVSADVRPPQFRTCLCPFLVDLGQVIQPPEPQFLILGSGKRIPHSGED